MWTPLSPVHNLQGLFPSLNGNGSSKTSSRGPHHLTKVMTSSLTLPPISSIFPSNELSGVPLLRPPPGSNKTATPRTHKSLMLNPKTSPAPSGLPANKENIDQSESPNPSSFREVVQDSGTGPRHPNNPHSVVSEVLRYADIRSPVPVSRGFECPVCRKPYHLRKHCRRHMVLHTSARPFTCGKCNAQFCRQDICRRHYSACMGREIKATRHIPKPTTRGGPSSSRRRYMAIS